MNKNEINALLEKYFEWLKDKTFSKEINSEWISISTPFLDRHNDCLQIYTRQENGKIRLSDDGYIIGDLASCGCFLDSPYRKDLLETTLSGFGISSQKDELFTFATAETFSEKKHNLIQAMLAVDELFYVASPNTLNLFFDDVMTWFDSIDLRYTPKLKFQGKSSFDQMFDFCIPKSKNFPERIVQAVSNPTKEGIQNIVFKWFDTKENRPEKSRLLAIINDGEKGISQQIRDALENYDIQPIVWSRRNDYKDLLAA
ncbi:MAG: DUF1829 domain-containing protein [Bacteroides sp.]|nr:DUF1829 domain-containing protein [Prevotella sp.]MCM1408886.1 DUF1829 domain-containing protein [Treponema brennaborense]MCM1470853.1 DUF1829 domain-containing protein [Bacteroides sp.]